MGKPRWYWEQVRDKVFTGILLVTAIALLFWESTLSVQREKRASYERRAEIYCNKYKSFSMYDSCVNRILKRYDRNGK